MLGRWLTGIALLGLPFWWGEPLDFTLVDATPLVDMLGEERRLSPMLSPDGSLLAWMDNDGICLYAFESASTTCTAWPDDTDLRPAQYNQPVWSPDSRQLVLHEDWIIRMREPDLWAFDVATGNLTRLTDDGVDGNMLRPPEGSVTMIDFAPFFHPASNDLYWWRLAGGPDGFSMSDARLVLMTMTDGAAVEVRDLTADVPHVGAVYQPGVFSADGSQLFVPVMPPSMMNDPATGIYTLDMNDDSFEQLASLQALQTSLPRWGEGMLPTALHTAADGLLVWMDSMGRSAASVARTPVFVDTTTGSVTSVIDYSGLDTPDAIEAARQTDEVNAFDNVRTGHVMPDGQTLWMLMLRRVDDGALFSVTLPPGDAMPERLLDVDAPVLIGPDADASLSDDGKLLLAELLVTFSAE